MEAPIKFRRVGARLPANWRAFEIFRPASKAFRVTEAVGARVVSLNGVPAIEAFEEHARTTGQRLDRTDALPFFLHNILGIDTGNNHRLRVPLVINEDGSITCAADIPTGARVHVMQLLRLKGVTSREHEVLERQVTHLLRLVDDLLDVARINAWESGASERANRNPLGCSPRDRDREPAVRTEAPGAVAFRWRVEFPGHGHRIAKSDCEGSRGSLTRRVRLVLFLALQIEVGGALRHARRGHLGRAVDPRLGGTS